MPSPACLSPAQGWGADSLREERGPETPVLLHAWLMAGG